MLQVLPQACPAPERTCGESATGLDRIDSAHGTFRCNGLYRLTNREFGSLLNVGKRIEARLLAAVAAGALVLTPAFGTTLTHKRPPPVSVSFDPISSFTPANADPNLAAALAGKSLSLSDFKFTPAPAKGRPSQIRVAIRARVDSPTETRVAAAAPAAAVTALTPASYNLGVAVGWRRFAVAGDVAKVREANPA